MQLHLYRQKTDILDTTGDGSLYLANDGLYHEVSGGGGTSDNIWQGRTAAFYGDSITALNHHYTKGYHSWIKDILGLASYTNFGVSGYDTYDVYEKVNSTSTDADLICVMIGIGEQTYSVPLGKMGDTTSTTVYGRIDMLCGLLKSKYPTKAILYITPPFQTKYPSSLGITSYDVSKAIKEVCEKYTIVVYDNFVFSEIYSTNLTTYTTDRCHWNDKAHEKVGKNLAQFILNTFRYIDSATPVTKTYLITNNLTKCTSDNTETTIEKGESYTATITANDGCTIQSVVCTMGGEEQEIVGNTINIASVTGNIIITAIATNDEPVPVYSVTNYLSHCTNSNTLSEIEEGESYFAVITADSNYTIYTISCAMGGEEQEVVGSTINITNVTSDIVITATATSTGVPVTKVVLSGALTGLATNDTRQLNAALTPSDATDTSLTWTASNENATVDENGLVTGVTEGSCTITATATSGVSETADFTIVAPKNNAYFEGKTFTMLKYYKNISFALCMPIAVDEDFITGAVISTTITGHNATNIKNNESAATNYQAPDIGVSNGSYTTNYGSAKGNVTVDGGNIIITKNVSVPSYEITQKYIKNIISVVPESTALSASFVIDTISITVGGKQKQILNLGGFFLTETFTLE